MLLLFELVVPSVTFGVMAEEILGNDFPLYDTQDADATEQAAKTSIQIITNASVFFITIFLSVVSDLAIANERGLRYTDIVLVERSSPMRWLLSGIVLQGLSLLLAEAKTKLCPMEYPLSSIPFHYIKRAGFKKVAVIIKLFLVDRAKKRSEDRLNAALNRIAFAFHKSIADRVGVRRFGMPIRIKNRLDTIRIS